jgi:integrase/recombinase XerD
MRKKLAVNWSNPFGDDIYSQHNYKLVLRDFARYLKNLGLRDSTIVRHVQRVNRFLNFAGTDTPSLKDFHAYRKYQLDVNLSRSTLNNNGFAIRHFYRMYDLDIDFTFIKPNNYLPIYFDEEDVLKIFSACERNIKHNAMLRTAFFACLRASELCHLNDRDLNLNNLTIHVRNGKGGKDGIALITPECAEALKGYLKVRPKMEIDGRNPLFYTDFGRLWDRRDLYRLFIYYKQKAGITKTGGIHVFSRHTPATLMIANGADIRIVQQILRHSSIQTTLRYAHVSDKTLRDRYMQTLGVI